MGYCLLDSHLSLASIFQSILLDFLLTFWVFHLGSPVGPVHFHIQFFLLNSSVLHSTICLSLLRASRIKSSFDDFLVLLKSKVQFSSVQFSRLVVSDSLRPHELQHARPPRDGGAWWAASMGSHRVDMTEAT